MNDIINDQEEILSPPVKMHNRKNRPLFKRGKKKDLRMPKGVRCNIKKEGVPSDIYTFRRNRFIIEKKKQIAEKKEAKKIARMNSPHRGHISCIKFTAFCPIAYDFSFTKNSECLGCEFCYKLKESAEIIYSSLYLEKHITKEKLQVPIIISAHCDPMMSDAAKRDSYKVAKYILENNGKVIYKTAKSYICENMFSLASEYKERFLYQPRFIVDNSRFGFVVKNNIAKNFDSTDDILREIYRFKSTGCQIVPIFDPVILHINDHLILPLIVDLKKCGINSIILKQVFANDMFRSKVLLYNPEAFKDLSIKIGAYHTYDNIHLIEHLAPIFETEMNLSFCSNNHINKLLGIYNCCQFEGQKVFYRNDQRFYNTKNRNEKICL